MSAARKRIECAECEEEHDAGAPHTCDPDELEWARRRRARAAEREAKMAPPWSPIVRKRVAGDFRDHLDGEPIHCGDMLELQGVETKSDDHGTYDARLTTGAVVRYELAHVERTKENPWGRVVVLYASVAGHSVNFPAEPWHRFRWPRRS